MHRVAVHDSYCGASALKNLLAESKAGSQLALSLHLSSQPPKSRLSVELIRSSRRKQHDVPDIDLLSFDEAVQRDVPLYSELKPWVKASEEARWLP